MSAAFASGINAQEDEQEQGETPEGRTAVGEERQRNTDDGGKPCDHPYVDEDVEEKDGEHRIAKDAAESGGLSFGQHDKSQDEREKEEEYSTGAEKTFFFADGAEDEVGVLFGHVVEFGLRAIHKAFSTQAP